MNTTSDPRDDAFTRSHRGKREHLDLWAVWPNGIECSLEEKRDLAELQTWLSDDFEIKTAIGYDGAASPIFGRLE